MKVKAKCPDLKDILSNRIYDVTDTKEFMDNKMIKINGFKPMWFNINDFDIVDDSTQKVN